MLLRLLERALRLRHSEHLGIVVQCCCFGSSANSRLNHWQKAADTDWPFLLHSFTRFGGVSVLKSRNYGTGPVLIGVNARSGRRTDVLAMPTASERVQNCKAHADQCRAWADLTKSAMAKEAFLAAALQWDTLAKEIEEIELARQFLERVERQ